MNDRIIQAFTLVRRNRASSLFPGKMTEDEKERHYQWVQRGLESADRFILLSPKEAERWRLTHPFAAQLSNGGEVVWTHESGLFVIADGEDGVIFCFCTDHEKAKEAYQHAEKCLFSYETPAQTEQLGYLTARPILSGLAVQQVYILHLPILRTLKQMRVTAQEAKKSGCELLGVAEEETDTSALYAVVNSKGSADDLQTLLASVQQVSENIAEKEYLLADRLMAIKTSRLCDEAFRAFGLLSYAQRLSAREWRTLWSQLRMGAMQGIVPVSPEGLDRLFMPALYPEETQDIDQQVLRARMVRTFLKEEQDAVKR